MREGGQSQSLVISVLRIAGGVARMVSLWRGEILKGNINLKKISEMALNGIITKITNKDMVKNVLRPFVPSSSIL